MPLLIPQARPTIPFEQWGLDTARSVVHVPMHVVLNRLFYRGDHWQSGTGWVGPHPAIGEKGADEAWAEIARAFTAQNIIREIIDRRTHGVMGREPMWKLVPRRLDPETKKPTNAQQTLIDEATDFLTAWWDERGVHETLQRWMSTLLWGERADLRMYVPPAFMRPGRLQDGTRVRTLSASNPADALRQLYVDDLSPEEGTLYESPLTRQQASVYLYTLEDQFRAEMTWLDPVTGVALQRQLGAPGSLQAPPARLNLGGRLPFFEAQHPEFISEQVRQLQRAMNLALTMLPHNLVTSGFLEMVVLSGQMPGHWEQDQATGKRTFVAHPMVRGAQVVQWINGQELGEDQDQLKHRTQPSVEWRPIAPLTPVIEGISDIRVRMLDVANQAHVVMNSSAEPSGRSRDSARTEFGGSLRQPRARGQRAGRWTIETALAWVELLTGNVGRWTSELRCDFTAQLDLGPVSTEERAQDLAAVEQGVFSVELAQERAGVEDVDAEGQRISSSRRGMLLQAQAEIEVVQLWIDAGWTPEGAMVAAGIPEERREELLDLLEPEPTAAELGTMQPPGALPPGGRQGRLPAPPRQRRLAAGGSNGNGNGRS